MQKYPIGFILRTHADERDHILFALNQILVADNFDELVALFFNEPDIKCFHSTLREP